MIKKPLMVAGIKDVLAQGTVVAVPRGRFRPTKLKHVFYCVSDVSFHDGVCYSLDGIKVHNGRIQRERGRWGCAWVPHADIDLVYELPEGFVNNDQINGLTRTDEEWDED